MHDEDRRTAAAFRNAADAKGLLLRTSDDQESRFTFELRRGAIVTSRHPSQLRQLLELAKEHWGQMRGEHAELLLVAAPREDLSGSAPPTNIVWKLAVQSPKTIYFKTWIEDQFIGFDARKMPGFPG
ncbi:MAG: hypothetical protein QY323_00130 [Patescibacteria group bacterium]|nr:MAG: hypothetical protein QY323_00130 [Patescibacteria group bacterium]